MHVLHIYQLEQNRTEELVERPGQRSVADRYSVSCHNPTNSLVVTCHPNHSKRQTGNQVGESFQNHEFKETVCRGVEYS